MYVYNSLKIIFYYISTTCNAVYIYIWRQGSTLCGIDSYFTTILNVCAVHKGCRLAFIYIYIYFTKFISPFLFFRFFQSRQYTISNKMKYAQCDFFWGDCRFLNISFFYSVLTCALSFKVCNTCESCNCYYYRWLVGRLYVLNNDK